MRGPSRSNPPSYRESSYVNQRECVSDDEKASDRLADAISNNAQQQLQEDLQRRRDTNKRRGSTSSLGDELSADGTSSHDINNQGDHHHADILEDRQYSAALAEFRLSESFLTRGDQKKRRPKHYQIDQVIPNLRDISVSSCHPNIKPGHLYRAARPFSRNINDIYDTLVKTLKIRTIIDLRDDNLTPIVEEAEARLLVSTFFKLTPITAEMNKCRQELDASRDLFPDNNIVDHGSGGLIGSNDEILRRREKRDRNETILFDALKVALPKIPEDVLRELSSDPYLRPIINMIFRSEKRRLLIVNVLDSPAVKKRVLQTLAGSPYLPLMALARAADKVTGITAYAPFYFCKYIMADRNIEESYVEMLHTCGVNFGIALKAICLSPSPILFHCSLGKDRTGLLSMLVLSILGVSESAMIFDYTLTSQAGEKYQAYNKRFIVEISGLTEAFCESNAETMRCVLNHVRRTWGTVDVYLDSIDFTKKWRDCFRLRFLVDPAEQLSTASSPNNNNDQGSIK